MRRVVPVESVVGAQWGVNHVRIGQTQAADCLRNTFVPSAVMLKRPDLDVALSGNSRGDDGREPAAALEHRMSAGAPLRYCLKIFGLRNEAVIVPCPDQLAQRSHVRHITGAQRLQFFNINRQRGRRGDGAYSAQSRSP